MRYFLTFSLVAGSVLISSLAFAHGKGGACKQYFVSCKADATVTAAAKGADREAAMKACVKTAAASDEACTAELAKHKGGGGHHHDSADKPAEGGGSN